MSGAKSQRRDGAGPLASSSGLRDRLWFQWAMNTIAALVMGAPVFWSYPDDRWLMLAAAPVLGLVFLPLTRKWRRDDAAAANE